MDKKNKSTWRLSAEEMKQIVASESTAIDAPCYMEVNCTNNGKYFRCEAHKPGEKCRPIHMGVGATDLGPVGIQCGSIVFNCNDDDSGSGEINSGGSGNTITGGQLQGSGSESGSGTDTPHSNPIDACSKKNKGDACSWKTDGKIRKGTCDYTSGNVLTCKESKKKL